MPTLLRTAALLLILACAGLAGCSAVTPASGPPTYGDVRDRGGGP